VTHAADQAAAVNTNEHCRCYTEMLDRCISRSYSGWSQLRSSNAVPLQLVLPRARSFHVPDV
jgi:hypothetical protein